MIEIPRKIIRNENKDAVIEEAKAFLYNDMFFDNVKIPEILKNEPEVLELLGLKGV